MIDEVGGFDRALDLLKQKAKIPATDSVRLVEFPERKSLWELLLSRAERGQARLLPAPLSRWLANASQLESMAHRPIWAWLPATFKFR